MTIEQFLARIVSIWESHLKAARESKKELFGNMAERLWKYMGKDYTDTELENQDPDMPHYKPRLNKCAEAVSILVPWCLGQAPYRKVMPRRPPLSPELAAMFGQDPMNPMAGLTKARDAAGAYLQEWFLNYTQTEYNLKREARTGLPEAFVKGRGLLWCEMVPSAAGIIPASLFVSVDDLLIDPAARQVRDAGIIWRKRTKTRWQVAQEFGIPIEDIPAGGPRATTMDMPSDAAASQKWNESTDLCSYYEGYSRMGLGHVLLPEDKELDEIRETMDLLGQNCYLAIMPGVPYPLNLPRHIFREEAGLSEIQARLRWPIPFHADTAGNPWPASLCDFRPHQKDAWASSVLADGHPLQVFIDHIYAFVMGHTRVTSQVVLLAAKELDQAMVDQIGRGGDLKIIRADGTSIEKLEKLLKSFEWPELKQELWNLIPMLERAYERATGLTPLLYGAEGETQIRSAQEFAGRDAHVSSRPNDYADGTEDWLSSASAKEAQAARLMVDLPTVAGLFGEPAPPMNYPQGAPFGWGPMTEAWGQIVHTDDEVVAASEYTYQIQAGTARKKNKSSQAANVQQFVQTVGQSLVGFAMQGVTGPFNAMVRMVGESLDMDVEAMLLPEGQPIAAGPPDTGEGDNEQA